jgi:hypothetical protein
MVKGSRVSELQGFRVTELQGYRVRGIPVAECFAIKTFGTMILNCNC